MTAPADTIRGALAARLYAALKHPHHCVCGECSGGLNAAEDLVRRLEAQDAEIQRQEAKHVEQQAAVMEAFLARAEAFAEYQRSIAAELRASELETRLAEAHEALRAESAANSVLQGFVDDALWRRRVVIREALAAASVSESEA